MENEQPELIARPKKSKTPLIIGIVVGIHVVLIGSAFIMQQVQKKTAGPEQQAGLETEATPEAGTAQSLPDSMVTMPEKAPVETASLTAPQQRGDLVVPVMPEKKAAPKAKIVKKTYTVKKGDTWKAVAARLKVPVSQLAKDNKLDSKKFLKIGQKLAYKQTIKQAAPPAEVVTASAPKIEAKEEATGSFALYEVKKGDTLGSIANRHAMKVADLKTANELKNDKIVVGQKLKVQQPGPKPTVHSLVADVEPREYNPQVHVIAKGETVSQVARRYGVSAAALLKANQIDDPTKLGVGQRIKIPTLDPQVTHEELKQASTEQETLEPVVEVATRI
jgi:LysM repeat protein